jgi:hypothetical protein
MNMELCSAEKVLEPIWMLWSRGKFVFLAGIRIQIAQPLELCYTDLAVLFVSLLSVYNLCRFCRFLY